MNTNKITELFCDVDDFYKKFEIAYNKQALEDGKIFRDLSSQLSVSVIVCILISFHQPNFRTFKHFYLTLRLTHGHVRLTSNAARLC